MTSETFVKVGMADLNVLCGAGILKTSGLGSCVGITLYDPVKRVAGMAHIMLPSSAIARDPKMNEAKYADTAIPLLVHLMGNQGASRDRLKAKLAGGSQMFAFSSGSDMMRIGPRNVEACTGILVGLGIPVVAADTGGNYGRTIELDGASGRLTVRSVQYGMKEL